MRRIERAAQDMFDDALSVTEKILKHNNRRATISMEEFSTLALATERCCATFAREVVTAVRSCVEVQRSRTSTLNKFLTSDQYFFLQNELNLDHFLSRLFFFCIGTWAIVEANIY